MVGWLHELHEVPFINILLKIMMLPYILLLCSIKNIKNTWEYYCLNKSITIFIFLAKTGMKKVNVPVLSMWICAVSNSETSLKTFLYRLLPCERESLSDNKNGYLKSKCFLAEGGHGAEMILGNWNLHKRLSMPWGVRILILFYWILL